MKTIRFIINPISGVGKKNTVPPLIEKYLDHTKFKYELIYTEYRKHAFEISKQASEDGIDIVCVVGGDGSVNEAGTALIGSKTIFSILPTGSGNGVARHMGIPLNLKKAIQRINREKVVIMDTVDINNHPAIGVSGFGFDAIVAKRFDEYHKRGLASYAKLVLKEWRGYKGIDVVYNGEMHKNLLFCCIANTNQFGNNFVISPTSDVTDGKIEIVIVKLPKTFALMGLLLSSLLKKVGNSEYVMTYKTDKANLIVHDTHGHIDGDPITCTYNQLTVNCVPKSLKIIV